MPEPPPKTYSTKDRFEYFRPCVQVEMEYPEKFDTVTEIYVRGNINLSHWLCVFVCLARSVGLGTCSRGMRACSCRGPRFNS